jgi:hypothetical protein
MLVERDRSLLQRVVTDRDTIHGPFNAFLPCFSRWRKKDITVFPNTVLVIFSMTNGRRLYTVAPRVQKKSVYQNVIFMKEVIIIQICQPFVRTGTQNLKFVMFSVDALRSAKHIVDLSLREMERLDLPFKFRLIVFPFGSKSD